MDVDKFPEGLQVLAVDDNRAGLLLLRRQLKFCNYNKVTTVTNTTTALDMLRERKGRDDQFDLVVSDIFMVDDIDGFKLLEHISLEMDIPVIFDHVRNVVHLVPYKLQFVIPT
uniref:Response regulatory domain-containing protein n=1 Tax=Setaria italica TaxID=4555 RepID=K3Y210_SETIT